MWVSGELQAANEAESKLHWKLEPASEEEKLKVGVASLVSPEGPESIVVSGSVASTVKPWESGLGSGFPAASTALTWKVWKPSARALVRV